MRTRGGPDVALPWCRHAAEPAAAFFGKEMEMTPRLSNRLLASACCALALGFAVGCNHRHMDEAALEGGAAGQRKAAASGKLLRVTDGEIPGVLGAVTQGEVKAGDLAKERSSAAAVD